MNYQHLTQEQRYQLLGHLQAGISQTESAAQLNVHKSTVSREIKRNKGRRGYQPRKAHLQSLTRRRRIKSSVEIPCEVYMLVVFYLLEKWSPDQISNYIYKEFNLKISHESIYKYIAKDKLHGGNLYKCLRQGHRRRRKVYGSKHNTRGIIKDRVSIKDRPNIVDRKCRIGDWEADTVVSRQSKTVLITLVERKTKLTLIKKVPNKTAQVVSEGIIKLLIPYKSKVHTITFDNGKEFAKHKLIKEQIQADIYFADPFSSWQRGLNENTNGLIRQYLPKKTDFSKVSEEDIQNIENALNNRPRKTLDYCSPNDNYN